MSRTRTPDSGTALERSEPRQATFCRRRGLALATFGCHRARAVTPPDFRGDRRQPEGRA